MTDADGHRATVTVAATAGAAMVLTFVAVTVFGGATDSPAGATAGDPVTDQPLTSNAGRRAETRASAPTATTAAADSTTTTGAAAPGSAPRPAPTSWAQEVAAAGPNDSIRLTPLASDWTAENIVIGKDLAGKFLGRVSVRYSGPGSAQGSFAVTLLKDGKEITTLTGDLVEVRAGVYQVMLSTAAAWVEGPWATRFTVRSTT